MAKYAPRLTKSVRVRVRPGCSSASGITSTLQHRHHHQQQQQQQRQQQVPASKFKKRHWRNVSGDGIRFLFFRASFSDFFFVPNHFFSCCCCCCCCCCRWIFSGLLRAIGSRTFSPIPSSVARVAPSSVSNNHARDCIHVRTLTACYFVLF